MYYLKKGVSLKVYGNRYFAYQKDTDELYEIDFDAFSLFKKASTNPEYISSLDKETIEFLSKEQLITSLEKDRLSEISVGFFPNKHEPPLKYLHLIITTRCNFSCKHCYVAKDLRDMDLEKATEAIKEFETIGGLRLIISGGEPLEHPDFFRLNEFLVKVRGVRKILLTNGWSLSELSISEIRKLNFEEVQVSIDGTKEVHDWIRKRGSFDRALKSISMLKRVGISVSVATVLNSKNVLEFENLKKVIESIEPLRWSVDFLCETPQARKYNLLPPLESANLISFSFNSGFHGSEKGYACGSNLASLLPDGTLCKCDYLPEVNGGNVFSESLIGCWLKLKKLKINDLECSTCSCANECRGGCRYRALIYNGSIRSKDPVACRLYGYHEGSLPKGRGV